MNDRVTNIKQLNNKSNLLNLIAKILYNKREGI